MNRTRNIELKETQILLHKNVHFAECVGVIAQNTKQGARNLRMLFRYAQS
jgi:hypothetical protein